MTIPSMLPHLQSLADDEGAAIESMKVTDRGDMSDMSSGAVVVYNNDKEALHLAGGRYLVPGPNTVRFDMWDDHGGHERLSCCWAIPPDEHWATFNPKGRRGHRVPRSIDYR